MLLFGFGLVWFFLCLLLFFCFINYFSDSNCIFNLKPPPPPPSDRYVKNNERFSFNEALSMTPYMDPEATHNPDDLEYSLHAYGHPGSPDIIIVHIIHILLFAS